MHDRSLLCKDDMSFLVHFGPLFRQDYEPVYYIVVDYGDGFEYCENDKSKPCDRGPLYLVLLSFCTVLRALLRCLAHKGYKKLLNFRKRLLVQVGSSIRVHDTRWHCARQYTQTLLNGVIELFYIDTSPFIQSYYETSWAKYKGGLLEQSWEGQLRELEGRLLRSTATWKLIVGHHPPRSNGHHGNATELMRHLEPILQRYHVQVGNAVYSTSTYCLPCSMVFC